MAYMERAEELMTSSTCSETDSLSVNVTPRIFNDVTRAILSNVGGDVMMYVPNGIKFRFLTTSNYVGCQ